MAKKEKEKNIELTEYTVIKLHNGNTDSYGTLTSCEPLTVDQAQFIADNIGRDEVFEVYLDGVIKASVNLRFYSDVKFLKNAD